MPSTYTPIASSRITNNSTASYTFSAIPGTYTDLYLVVVGGIYKTSQDMILRLNGDTGTNYSVVYAFGNQSYKEANNTFMYMDYWGNGINVDNTMVWKVNIMNYANTTTFKTMLMTSGRGQMSFSGSRAYGLGAGHWRSTAAVTSVTVLPTTSANFTTNTILTLYGIKAA